MKISKVVRRKGGAEVSALNVVVATNVGETDQDTSVKSRQRVKITQRDGHTEVRAVEKAPQRPEPS